MTIFQTIVFAIVQGISELFPISSVAHGVLTPYFFQWNLSPDFLKENFLPFLVMLHLGTAVALLLFFGSEWLQIIGSLFNKDKAARKLLWIIIAGTFPAAIIGLVLESPLRHMFSNITSAAIFLTVNGFILYWGEKIKTRGHKDIKELTYQQALIIGLFQALALVPGFSRSGATITAGFWLGLKHGAAARLSMLLATPIIIGAGIIEVPKLFHTGATGVLEISLMGGVVAGIAAYVSVWALMKWFNTNEVTAMRPFAWYCWLVGIGVLVSRFI
ncbi:MAG: Undecaprenyl-diphosphatase [Firmicutes bacterium]|nr:Undecaprenyl-diphosphatase [Bacillota bacterium]